MELFGRLDAVRDRWNVLRHPFYRRWSEGRLERDELAFYAGEYRHAVVALAEQTAAAAREAPAALRTGLERHAAEEAAHVGLWDDFARAVGVEDRRPPLPETAGCREAWTAGDGLPERLAVLYAVESSQPAISRTKLEGLVAHYGLAGDPAATAYFALHSERDHDHAAQSRALIAERGDERDDDRLVARAEGALAGNWALLDGVEARLTAGAV